MVQSLISGRLLEENSAGRKVMLKAALSLSFRFVLFLRTRDLLSESIGEFAFTTLNDKKTPLKDLLVSNSVVKNIDISINIDTEISERYQY